MVVWLCAGDSRRRIVLYQVVIDVIGTITGYTVSVIKTILILFINLCRVNIIIIIIRTDQCASLTLEKG